MVSCYALDPPSYKRAGGESGWTNDRTSCLRSTAMYVSYHRWIVLVQVVHVLYMRLLHRSILTHPRIDEMGAQLPEFATETLPDGPVAVMSASSAGVRGEKREVRHETHATFPGWPGLARHRPSAFP